MPYVSFLTTQFDGSFTNKLYAKEPRRHCRPGSFFLISAMDTF